MRPLLLLLLPLLRCLRSHGEGGESPPAPLRPRFEAKTFHHVLRWDPPPPPAPGPEQLRYEVQYRLYGHSNPWTPVPSCVGITCHTCDLSYETREPSKRYHVRVRAVVGPRRASKWVPVPVFRPEQATLWLSNVSLAVHNGSIRVSVQLPISPWDNITYEDLHPWWRQYRVYVRSESNRTQLEYTVTTTEFDLPALPRGERYCVSVEPQVISQKIPAERTEEVCISIPPLEEGHLSAASLICSIALVSLPILGALVVSLGLAWVYVNQPAKTFPVVLKSALKCPFPQGLQQLPPPGMKEVVLQVERVSVQSLSTLGPKEQTSANQTWGIEIVPSLPEKLWWLGGLAEGRVGMREGLEEGSIGGSTDSGICLRDAGGSLGHLLPFGSSQEGGSLGDFGGMGGEAELMQETLAPTEVPLGGFSGYQKQVGATPEAAACWGPPLDTEGAGHPQLGLVTGYLKQASFGVPAGVAAGQPLSQQKGPPESGLPSWQGPRGLGMLETSPCIHLGIGLL